MSEAEPETSRPWPGRSRAARALLGVLAAALLAGCGSWGGSRSGAAPRTTVPIGTMATRPNIIFILTDDLSSNLVRYMPHVRAMERRGATFSNYYVTDSLCCPSRTSIFTGLLPHDSGVYANTGPDGGMVSFDSHRDTERSYGLVLKHAGYRTAMMGKYLNGYEPQWEANTARPYIPMGWSEWDVTGNGYQGWDYALNQNRRLVSYGSGASAYLTTVLDHLASSFVAKSAPGAVLTKSPFAIEVATFAPHEPYTYAPRDATRFRGVRAPRTPAFDHRDLVGNPKWLDLPRLSSSEMQSIDRDFVRRVRAVQAIDRMIGALENQVAVAGLGNSTYFVFSSDNGYHMGEHRLRPGKLTAFDTDIRVPLVIDGPGIRPGMRIDAMADNVDLAPTFEQLAGVDPPSWIDGRSLVPLLTGHVPSGWRHAVLVEHRGPDHDTSDPDYPQPESANPPSYEAMRLKNALYVEYVDGEREYYNTARDPFELRNTYSQLAPAWRRVLHRDLMGLKHCHGSAECHQADQLLPYASP